jgi:hypothetical protein
VAAGSGRGWRELALLAQLARVARVGDGGRRWERRENVYKTGNVSSHKESGMERGLKAKMAGGALGVGLWLTFWWLVLWCCDWVVDYACIVEPWNDAGFDCTGDCVPRIEKVKTWCKTKTCGTGYSSHVLTGFDDAMFFTIGGIIAGIVGSAVAAKVECWRTVREAFQAYLAHQALVQAAVQAHMAQVAAAVADDGDAVPWHGESEWMRVSGG